MLRLLIIILTLSLSGCLAIPLSVSKTYQQDLVESLQADGVTRSEVQEKLGAPDLTRDDGAIWMFGDLRHVFYLATYGSDMFVDDYQSLYLEFDGETVSHAEVIERRTGCSSTGVCMPMRGERFDKDRGELISHDTVITSTREDDAMAKQFTSALQTCSVYVYTTEAVVDVAIDGAPATRLSRDAYLHVQLPPGAHLIRAAAEYDVDEDMHFDCAVGETVFVSHHYLSGVIYRHDSAMEIVSAKDGQSAVAVRSLVLSDWAEDFDPLFLQPANASASGDSTCEMLVYRKAAKKECRSVRASVKIDGDVQGEITRIDYLLTKARSGSREIIVFYPSAESEWRVFEKLRKECVPGQRHHIQIELDSRSGGCHAKALRLNSVDAETAAPILRGAMRVPSL